MTLHDLSFSTSFHFISDKTRRAEEESYTRIKPKMGMDENVERVEKDKKPSTHICDFHQPEEETSSVGQTNLAYKSEIKNHQSTQRSVFSSPLETDFMMATAYDEALQKLFGNISANEVAVSLTRNSELRKLKIIAKRRSQNYFDEKKKEKEVEEKEVEVGNKPVSGARVNPTSTSSIRHDISQVHTEKNVEEINQNNEIRRLLDLLPSYDFSNSCAKTVDSLMKSSHKKDQFIFLIRLNQFVDENGFHIKGDRSALSLEGIFLSN